MPWSSQHISWLTDTGEVLNTSDGKQVKIFEFEHSQDEEVLSAWAKHFRNHYCDDGQIDLLRQGTGFTRAQYLTNIKFPHHAAAPGPSIRAGDFSEILVADYIEYVLNYWVPRTRFADKTVRNESTKGVDVIGFKFVGEGENPLDAMITFEAKAKFSGANAENRLQDAINDSAKDQIRKAESLNAIKQRLIDKNKLPEAQKIERFQNQTDKPYKEISGAVALLNSNVYDADLISGCTTAEHPNSSNIILLVIKGEGMMNLVHSLYERAANEA